MPKEKFKRQKSKLKISELAKKEHSKTSTTFAICQFITEADKLQKGELSDLSKLGLGDILRKK